MKIGYIGLGKMGKNMVLHLLEQGVEIVAWNRSPEPREEVAAAGAIAVEMVEELVKELKKAAPVIAKQEAGGLISNNLSEKSAGSKSGDSSPSARNDKGDARDDKGVIIWLMLPAGETTDEFIDKLIPLLSSGDLLIDGANSFFKDTLRRSEKLKVKGINFMDIGVSGGPKGARNGACLMIGGSKEDFERVREIVEKAAAPGAWGHFGEVGAGHFAKMVHNGIEYGMMEAIAEGAAILRSSQFSLDLSDVFRVYQQKSVIESRLVGWSEEALREDPELESYSAKIGHTGEGEWTVKTGEELGVSVPVLKDSFNVRVSSESDDEKSPNGFRNKLVSAMRGKFGGHSVKK